MTQQKGRVENIVVKEGATNGKPWALYSIKVGDNYYGVGFDSPPCKEGDVVEFDAGTNAKGYGEAKNIVVVEGASEAAPAAASPATKDNGGGYVDKRNISIQLQSSRKDALVTLQIMQGADAIPFPKDMEESARYDMLLQFVDELTAHHYSKLQEWTEAGGLSPEDVI